MPDVEQKSPVVLIVEREPLLRMYASDILTEDGGFRVIAAANATEASTILLVRPDVAVLFIDVNSQKDLEAVHAVHVNWPDRPIIITSALGLRFPLRAGVRFLAKPYTSNPLVALVRQVLGVSSSSNVAPELGCGQVDLERLDMSAKTMH